MVCQWCHTEFEAYRTDYCPHSIGPERQIGRGKFPKGLRKKGVKREVVLQEPFWEKQPYESARALEKWQYYRSLAPKDRSMTNVAAHFGLTPQAIRNVANQWKWAVRIEAYDVMKDREVLELERKDRKEAFERWRSGAQALQEIGNAKLQELIDEIAAQRKVLESDPAAKVSIDLTPDQAKAFTEAGIKLERLILDESTENVMHNTPAMKRELRLRDAVQDIEADLSDYQISHPEMTEEEREAFIMERIDWIEDDNIYQIDRESLIAALLGIRPTEAPELSN